MDIFDKVFGSENKKNDKEDLTQKVFGSAGLSSSNDLYNRYKEKSGRSVEMTPREISESPVLMDAIKANNRRFEDSMAKGRVEYRSHEFKNQTLRLRDGESTVLNKKDSPGGGDYWDRDISWGDSLGMGDVRTFSSLGSVKLRSTGSFKAIRRGREVLIDGVVEHGLKDKYDFNEGSILLQPWRSMAEKGEAKPFGIRGSKLQKMKGTLGIGNGEIRNLRFEWEDMD